MSLRKKKGGREKGEGTCDQFSNCTKRKIQFNQTCGVSNVSTSLLEAKSSFDFQEIWSWRIETLNENISVKCNFFVGRPSTEKFSNEKNN